MGELANALRRRRWDRPPAAADRGRKALRGLFYLGGAVATAAGSHTVAVGARSLPSRAPANAEVESELRFYAAFYVAYGLAVLSSARTADIDRARVRSIAGALFLAGVARAGGWALVGPPRPLQRALLAIELAAPPVMVGWQAALNAESRA